MSVGTDLGSDTASVALEPATFADNVGADLSVDGELVEYPLGPTTVVYTARDAAGNSAECSVVVTVSGKATNQTMEKKEDN